VGQCGRSPEPGPPGRAGHDRGGAVQLDPGLEAVDPTLAFRDFQLLKLKYDSPLSNFAFNCKLCHYTEGAFISKLHAPAGE